MIFTDADLAEVALSFQVDPDRREALRADAGARVRLEKLLTVQLMLHHSGGYCDFPKAVTAFVNYIVGTASRDETLRVEAFLTTLKAYADTPSQDSLSVETETSSPVWRDRFCLAVVSLASVACNWFLSKPGRPHSISAVDFWALTQDHLLKVGLGCCAAMILIALLCRTFGLVRSLRSLLPLAILFFAVATAGLYFWADHQVASKREALGNLFLNHQWVAFESPSFDPEERRPTDAKAGVLWDQMRRERIEGELEVLRASSGFDAVISFAPDDLGVPEIARRVGFKAVIMGIHLDDIDGAHPDFAPAIRMKDHVIGYCLGHNPKVPVDQLAGWMQQLREATGRPVTTTFPLSFYLGTRGSRVAEIGDWLFPDVHASWHLGTTPKEALEQTRAAITRVSELPRNKPVLLKMLSYPSAGAAGLGPAEQRDFFLTLGRDVWLPPGVHVSLFSAYDLPWKKRRPDEFAAPEFHVGLLTETGEAKPALEAIKKWPLIQARP